jgi:hypothetical protein
VRESSFGSARAEGEVDDADERWRFDAAGRARIAASLSLPFVAKSDAIRDRRSRCWRPLRLRGGHLANCVARQGHAFESPHSRVELAVAVCAQHHALQ